MRTIKSLVTHRFPHLDEIFAIWLLKNFGGERFEGIANATIEYWESGGVTPDGRTAEEWEADGYLLVGVGGGRFDEHPTATQERKDGDCAATLVAKYMGIIDEPWLQTTMDFIVRDDLKGSASQFDIGAIAKLLHQQYPNDPDAAIEWVMIGLGAKINEQISFWKDARQEFEDGAKTKIETTPGPRGEDIRIAVIRSDNPQVGKYARFSQGGNAQVVVQQRSTGNVQIFTEHRSGITLYETARLIRLEEQDMNERIVTTDWDELEAEGVVVGAENWFFQEHGMMLLNGSLTALGVAPTKIPLDTIVRLIKVAMNQNDFQRDRAAECRQGICGSTHQDECPWYYMGLKRCRRNLFNTRTQTRTANGR